MKTRHLIIPLALAATACAIAQSPEAATVVASPSTPAPAVPASAPAPSRIIHLPRLPSASELSAAAAAQHVTIARIEQTATQITVTYQSDGSPATTVVYRLLASATTEAPAAVTYRPAPPVVYYEDYGPGYYGPAYYGPGYWYPPVSLRFGFGYGFGGHRGGRWH